MKTPISKIFFALVLVSFVLSAMVCTGSKSGDFIFYPFPATDSTDVGDDLQPIVIVKIPGNDERSLTPISATYNNGTIEFDFYGNIGTLYTVVTNDNTGERWSEYIDTADGYYTMNIATSNYQGTYSLYMYTDDNTTYGGSFTIE